jgi:SAM-dependent methyltransferase
VIADVIEGVSYERLEQPGCLLCGRIHAARTIAGGFGMTAMVAECPDCRLAYQSPRPSLEASLAYMNMRWRSQDAYVADPALQRGRVQKQLELLAPLAGASPRVLDFGAGIGTFVRDARARGWQADGIERSESARERASEANGVELEADLASAPFEFDIITLWDVVEHLRDPRETIAALSIHLRPGGWMIFETGNWESWNRLASGDAWPLYLFDHQFYFSPASLRALVAGAGLTDFRLLPAGEAAPPSPPADGDAGAKARWDAYRRGLELWPEHAAIDIMVAAARTPRYAAMP